MAAYFIFRGQWWDYICLWDSRLYYLHLLSTVAKPFSLTEYCLFNHPSFVFASIASIPLHFFPDSQVLFNIWLTLLNCMGILAFHGIVKNLLGYRATIHERLLCTTLYIVHPMIFSNSIGFTLDLGVIIFFLVFWWAILEKKTIPVFISGLALIFSKESGMSIFPVPIIWSILFSDEDKWKKKLILVFCSFLILIAGYFYFRKQLNFPLLHAQGGYVNQISLDVISSIVKKITNLETGRLLLSHLYITSFSWVFIAVNASISLFVLFRSLILSKHPRSVVHSFQFGKLIFLISIFGFYAYLLTRAPFPHTRYILVLLPFWLIINIFVFFELCSIRLLRLILLWIMIALFLVSLFRTIDPISKRHFGVAKFGDHDYLRIFGNNLWYDAALNYNLEFFKFYDLQNKFLDKVRPDSRDVILLPYGSSWERWGALFFGPINKNFKLDIGKNTFMPRYGFVNDFISWANKPSEIYYVAWPFYDNGPDVSRLKNFYLRMDEKSVETSGYVLRYYHFYNL